MFELWDEQESGVSKEAKPLKMIDRLLPFLHNITSNGQAWQDNNIHKNQVLRMHHLIQGEGP
jgi:putative hydrolase of HD superfamily